MICSVSIAQGVLQEKLGGGVRPAFQIPYPIYDKNLWYSLPYLWTEQKLETLFMTWPSYQNSVSDLRYNKMTFPSSDQRWITINTFVDFLFDNDEKVASSYKHTHLKAREQNPYDNPIYEQNGQNQLKLIP